jgi:hypothetical protein
VFPAILSVRMRRNAQNTTSEVHFETGCSIVGASAHVQLDVSNIRLKHNFMQISLVKSHRFSDVLNLNLKSV